MLSASNSEARTHLRLSKRKYNNDENFRISKLQKKSEISAK